MSDVDVFVVGAGAVGLAVGAACARAGASVIVAERHAQFGSETSSRNSEVIHAGLYYPPGSLKARLCVAGRRALYAYCAARGVRAERIGKLIVAATDGEVPALETLMARGEANDVEGLAWLDPPAITAKEPALRAVRALWSPESGVFDSHGYMLALLGEIEDAGGALARGAAFVGAEQSGAGWRVRAGEAVLTATALVNAAGLSADAVGRAIVGAHDVPVIRFAKGSYFRYAGKAPFRHLIYPAPTPAGHGVHVTPDTGGRARFGPDVEMVPAIDYRVDPARRADFVAGIARYWPDVREDLLEPDYAGVRPKIGRAPAAFEDFRIETHGLSGLVCLYGIDSPGLTSSLALGAHVARLLGWGARQSAA